MPEGLASERIVEESRQKAIRQVVSRIGLVTKVAHNGCRDNLEEMELTGSEFPPLMRERESGANTQNYAWNDPSRITRSFADAAKGVHGAGPCQEMKKVEVTFNASGGIVMSDNIAEEGIRRWSNTLVGIVLGRRIPLAVIENNVRRMWRDCGVVEVVSAGLGMVFIKFDHDGRFNHILGKADWSIVGCPFLVRRWSPGMTYGMLEPSKLPLWIRLKNVPYEYCHHEGVQYIASSFGTPLKMDMRPKFQIQIRVQVEIDASAPLRRNLKLVGVAGQEMEILLDYEFMPPQCVVCGVFGHADLQCPKRQATKLEMANRVTDRRWQKVTDINRTKELVDSMREEQGKRNQHLQERLSGEEVEVVQGSILEEADGDNRGGALKMTNDFQVLNDTIVEETQDKDIPCHRLHILPASNCAEAQSRSIEPLLDWETACAASLAADSPSIEA